MDNIILEADGAYRGKDGGVASYGYLVKKNTETVREDYNILLDERVTNNYAEYMAVIKGLKWIKDSDLEFGKIIVRSDSQLVVKQVNGEWSVNSDNLKDLHKEVKELIRYFEEKNKSVEIEHVGRENNVEADELSQQALEDHLLAKKLKGEDKKMCPECGEEMVVREGEYGKFWGCTGYPDCDHTEKYEED
ncbi:MAG: reverse transcriptase-like protein [Candidatus Thermoplasmatota archaeon]|nr:reverse transcriptase-like protein [Candidatus Thermoplasmatota archaeon]MBS3790117.1 reverse transcriptase-like protein [Candidatus Thermoplasmatota archaeon]